MCEEASTGARCGAQGVGSPPRGRRVRGPSTSSFHRHVRRRTVVVVVVTAIRQHLFTDVTSATDPAPSRLVMDENHNYNPHRNAAVISFITQRMQSINHSR